MPPIERARAELLAARGDADAAWRLTEDDSICTAPRGKWFDRAMELEDPRALRAAALELRAMSSNDPPEKDAKTRAKVWSLLDVACRTDSRACSDLADAIEGEYFGTPDLTAARHYHERAANLGGRHSWSDLARALHEGLGGQADDRAAYYWISLEARCVDPRSVSGEKTWALREEIALFLSNEQLEAEWMLVDAYMDEVDSGRRRLDWPCFGGTSTAEEVRREGRRAADAREKQHRLLVR
jgi:TPR repeat protein